jgi:threonine aldolase
MGSVGGTIDLRSDTVTRPTAAMLAAMMAASVGDDVYGEDPSVNELERRTAELLGFEAALFVPSGTMANQLAVALQTRPGETVLAEQDAHAYLFEGGAGAALSGITFDLLSRDERLSDEALLGAVRPRGNLHTAPTTLLVVENTHNVGGGRVLRADEMQRIAGTAKRLDLACHCDGARIWNAACALGVAEKSLLTGFDTASVCFSKGLGAPAGSAFVGTKAQVLAARRLRKRWGGGMRQVGYLAAAALYALDHHRERLAEDHANAASLAAKLRALSAAGFPVEVQYPEPGTNMVFFRLRDGRDAEVHVAWLKDHGVLVNSIHGGWIRAVLHLDAPRARVETAAGILAERITTL